MQQWQVSELGGADKSAYGTVVIQAAPNSFIFGFKRRTVQREASINGPQQQKSFIYIYIRSSSAIDTLSLAKFNGNQCL